jgi:hypothetical protein
MKVNQTEFWDIKKIVQTQKNHLLTLSNHLTVSIQTIIVTLPNNLFSL